MKSSTLFSIIVVSTLAAGSVAYAQGRVNASGAARAQAPVVAQGIGSTTGIQAKLHTPGTGLLPGAMPQQTRIHTPGVGAATPGAGQAAGSNGGHGIHTPGTGLVTPAPVPVPRPVGG